MKDVKEVLRFLKKYERYNTFDDYHTTGNQDTVYQYYLVLHYILNMFPEKDKEDMRIMDVGCRYGYFIDVLSKLGYERAIGIDKRDWAKKAKDYNINTEMIDVLEMSSHFENESFDLISAIYFFHYDLKNNFRADGIVVKDVNDWITDVFSEIHKVLKKKGVFLCDPQIILPISRIEGIGFKVKYKIEKEMVYEIDISKEKYKRNQRVKARKDFFVFEKT